MSATASAASGGRTTSDATRRLTRECASSRPSPASPSRSVTTSRTGWPATLSARYSRTAKVSGSAHCRSSTTNVAVRSPASATRRRSTASPSTQPGPRRGNGRFAPLGHEHRQRRHERRQVPAGADAQPGRAEQGFPDRAQRRAAGGRPTDQHGPSLPDRPRAELADQPALADAGRSTHDAHRPAGSPRLAQPIDLAVPTHQLTSEQRSGRAHVHHPPTLPHHLDHARTPRAAWPCGGQALGRSTWNSLVVNTCSCYVSGCERFRGQRSERRSVTSGAAVSLAAARPTSRGDAERAARCRPRAVRLPRLGRHRHA